MAMWVSIVCSIWTRTFTHVLTYMQGRRGRVGRWWGQKRSDENTQKHTTLTTQVAVCITSTAATPCQLNNAIIISTVETTTACQSAQQQQYPISLKYVNIETTEGIMLTLAYLGMLCAAQDAAYCFNVGETESSQEFVSQVKYRYVNIN